MALTTRVRNPKGSGVPTSEPSFSSGEYLLYWDRKQNAAVVGAGPFKGRIWTKNREHFFRRKWHYVGILDGHRIKRLNNLTRADYQKILADGLRKVYMSTAVTVPREFRSLSLGTSS